MTPRRQFGSPLTVAPLRMLAVIVICACFAVGLGAAQPDRSWSLGSADATSEARMPLAAHSVHALVPAANAASPIHVTHADTNAADPLGAATAALDPPRRAGARGQELAAHAVALHTAHTPTRGPPTTR